ncbi:MAG: vWA domain-containing protein [Armatimonadota bacterium]
MHILSPWWLLLFLPLAGLLILLYLLKLRRRNHVVPSIFLWEQALQDLQANAPLQKLRKNLLLLVQLIILLFVVLALMRPAMQWRQASGRNVVLIMDVSASMRATDVLPNRFGVAKRAAQRAVEALGMHDRMMIVAVGGGVRQLTTFTNDKRQLRDALNALQVTDARADLRQAIDLAAGLTGRKRGSTPPEIMIFSDGAVPPVQLPSGSKLNVNFQRVGKRGDNVGIVMMSMRRRMTRQGDFEGLIGIRNFSDVKKTFTLELSLNGRLLDARDVTLPAKGNRTEVLSQLPSDSGVLGAKIDLRDDLAVDNAASLILPKVDPVPVALATTGNQFLLTALGLDPTLEISEFSTAPATLARGSVLVADMVPVAQVPAGASALIIGQTSASLPITVKGTVEYPTIVDWNRRHPAMAYVDLSEAHISKAQVLRLSGGAEPLIETDAGPVAAAVEKNGQRFIYLGWDLHRSDFPLNASFPIFMANAMNWLSGERQRAQAVNVRTGEMVRLPMPAEAKDVRLKLPDGRRDALEVKGSTLSIDRVRQAGLYTLSGKGFEQQFTANLFDADESQLTPRNLVLTSSQGQQREVRARGSVHTQKEIWRTLALLALILLCVEWWIFHRRIG